IDTGIGFQTRDDATAGRDGASPTRRWRPRGDDAAAQGGRVAARGRRVAARRILDGDGDFDGDSLRRLLAG
ncbi:unnamed protein product, partial [Urochloa humidicola]